MVIKKTGNSHYRALSEAYTISKRLYMSGEPKIVIYDKIMSDYGFSKKVVDQFIEDIEAITSYNNKLFSIRGEKNSEPPK